MDVSMVNNDFYLSGMAALVGDIDSKRVNASTLQHRVRSVCP